MSDLIERLEVAAQWDDSPSSLIHEAIARIAALEAQLAARTGAVKVDAERAREALRELASVPMNLSLEDWNRISNTILSALEPAEPATDAEPERKWPAFVYDSEAEPNMRPHPTHSEARLRETLDEDDYEEIISAAAINMRKAASGIRGQMVTVQDSLDWWVMKETERRILSAIEPAAPEGQHEAGIPGLWWRIDVEASDFSLTFPDYSYRTVATLDAAKAAAQADYERRILSALEATLPAPKVAEARSSTHSLKQMTAGRTMPRVMKKLSDGRQR